ncbi:MAG: hypothetical protein H7Y04_04130 [Verrucomicrobia bacterium]|nr:hypothetical protein [Cytophagales bacterium]
MKLNQSARLLLLSLIVSVIHHTDHVLRIDHSGWPFLPQITSFTYSLLVYPIFLFIFLAKPWYQVFGTAFLFLFATIAHIFFEPMGDKFHTWAYGSNLSGHIGEENMLRQNSVFLGVCSIVLAMFLSLVLFATLLSFIKEARRAKTNNFIENNLKPANSRSV